MESLGKLFRSTDEQLTPVEAVVIGIIPEWLNGFYIRNGPAVFDVKDFTVNHLCDGFAVVDKFQINKGKVTYTKRVVASDAYKKTQKNGKPVYTQLGTKAYKDSSKGVLGKIVSNIIPDFTDNVSGNIFKLGETVYLSTESTYHRVLDPFELSTETKVNAGAQLNVNVLSSHVIVDHDGTAYSLGSSFSNGFKCKVIKIPKSTQPKEVGSEYTGGFTLATLDNRMPKFNCYKHSFGVSSRWLVYIDQPLYINNIKLMTAHLKERTILDCMQWMPHLSNRFFLIDKNTGAVNPIIYESSSPFFFLHVINAYEEGNEVVIDVIGHDSAEIIYKLQLKNLRNSDFSVTDKATPRRYVLPLIDDVNVMPEEENIVKSDSRVFATRIRDKIVVKGALLTEPTIDLPVLNKAYTGKKYKYFYGSGMFGTSAYSCSIVKVDVQTGEVLTWKDSDSSVPGEPQFIPTPKCTDEDGGVLLSSVSELREGRNSFLVIIDAKTMVEIARAEVDAHVPHLIHSIFIPHIS